MKKQFLSIMLLTLFCTQSVTIKSSNFLNRLIFLQENILNKAANFTQKNPRLIMAGYASALVLSCYYVERREKKYYNSVKKLNS